MTCQAAGKDPNLMEMSGHPVVIRLTQTETFNEGNGFMVQLEAARDRPIMLVLSFATNAPRALSLSLY